MWAETPMWVDAKDLGKVSSAPEANGDGAASSVRGCGIQMEPGCPPAGGWEAPGWMVLLAYGPEWRWALAIGPVGGGVGPGARAMLSGMGQCQWEERSGVPKEGLLASQVTPAGRPDEGNRKQSGTWSSPSTLRQGSPLLSVPVLTGQVPFL